MIDSAVYWSTYCVGIVAFFTTLQGRQTERERERRELSLSDKIVREQRQSLISRRTLKQVTISSGLFIDMGMCGFMGLPRPESPDYV